MNRLFSTIISLVFCIAVSAQGTCVIKGTIADDDKKIKNVTLDRTDDYGREGEDAKAKVKKGKFTFKRELAKDEPVLMYTILLLDYIVKELALLNINELIILL